MYICDVIIAEVLLKKRLTVIDEFRSHFESLWIIHSEHVTKQVCEFFK